ncbi:MAG: PAS domain S-box protein [Proteobacteria bacterium]|nr:PAS domain S-box protein [Pseudomonadota bacterium]
MEDPTKTVSIQEVTSPKFLNRFVLNEGGRTSYGYSNAAFWIKFSIAKDRHTPGKWYLKHSYPHLDTIEFYAPKKDGTYTLTKTGDSFLFSDRPVPNRLFVFPVFPEEAGSTYYLRLSSQGAINFTLSLVEEHSFRQQNHNSQFVAGLYLGALLIMVAYNLFFFGFVREQLYLYYGIHVLFIALHQIIWFGFGFEYLWPNHPGLNNILDMFVGSGLFFFLGVFAMNFLQTKQNTPRIHSLLMVTTSLVGICAMLSLVLERKYLLGLGNNMNSIQILVLFVAAITCLFKNLRQAYIFLVAWSIALLGGLSLALYKSGLLPEIDVFFYSIQVGILLNVLLISLGLADRINHMKNALARSREKIHQQNLVLMDKNDAISCTNETLAAVNQAFETQNQDLTKTCISLEMSEKRFRDLADLLPQTVFELDIDGNIIYSNRHGFEITGYSPEDYKNGINIFSLFRVKDCLRMKAAMASILASNAIGQGEYLLKQKNGDMVSVSLYASVILSKDAPVGFRGVLVDLSERKKAEERMIQTEKMMSLGGLAAGMAHEINNPLAGIIQSVQVVQNRLTKDLPVNLTLAEALGTSMSVITDFMEKRGVLKQLENIRNAGKNAAQIIENMLSFARKSDSVKREHSLEQILDNTLALAQNDYDLKKEYDFKHIEIIREYSPDVPRILCEGSKIQQVVFNILKNASYAMSSQKTKDCKPRLVLRLLKEEEMVLIEISDNGPGMDEKTRKKIFEPFFTTKSSDKGTGLGLSVSYFIIVDDHGGELKVDSAPGKGATFSIKLPIFR